ncbi:hypothetical protein [Rosenbergiella metrosideri]|uniref:hypothetical protein n=1 Tax=Rosenbergiella metrosideri TaxID=2921185 RepID=UPI001F4FA40D|nr:hypothetical protein [Rosenbergiella metrosideri]
MSFTISSTKSVNQVDPDSGVIVGTDTVTTELTVKVVNVTISQDLSASAGYKTSYGDSESEVIYFNFTYQGGEVITEAETELKKLLG